MSCVSIEDRQLPVVPLGLAVVCPHTCTRTGSHTYVGVVHRLRYSSHLARRAANADASLTALSRVPGSYVVAYQTGKTLYMSGHIPMTPEGKLLTGTVRTASHYTLGVLCHFHTMYQTTLVFFHVTTDSLGGPLECIFFPLWSSSLHMTNCRNKSRLVSERPFFGILDAVHGEGSAGVS